MNMFLATLNMIMSLNFTQIKHPLAMGLTLLIQTIIISLTCGLYTHSYWFAYILFLIMLGGMLVLFIYVTSLASNELFSFSIKNLMISGSVMLVMITLMMMMDTSMMSMNNIEMMSLNLNMLFTENEFSLIKLYNNPTMNITLLMMNYLLLALIVVVKITNVSHGPLRQKF
uniref:NADH dehydrogenase subunit 6 n=1 Tax=Austrogymnocnemia maculata TaxID=2929828 RepID=UPI002079CD49|nr:NADH dehydrogenase subunit 6 [Austrogymnocnemia maculata]URT60721.1 NADH dehydrogenase subunit 6 [Austrogymnocnemia maculata]